MKYLLILLFLINNVALAQERSQGIRLPEPKRFIDKVEVFAGPGLSFNYGNKFVENYKDDNVQNRRLVKSGYAFGVGLYHLLPGKFHIAASALLEQKGSKSQLRNADLVIDSEYDYRYLTFSLAPRLFIDRKKRFTLSIGGSYSLLKRVKGHEKVYSPPDVFKEHFSGRNVRNFRNDGSVYSITFIPGLISFEKYDYGATAGFAYLFYLKRGQALSVQLIDNLGLKNINKLKDGNFPEKNHTISLVLGYIHQRRNKELK